MLAAAGDIRLATTADEDLLRFAVAEKRVLVTEDVGDLSRIVQMWAATGEHHAGIVFTSPRRFHRGGTTYPEDSRGRAPALARRSPGWPDFRR